MNAPRKEFEIKETSNSKQFLGMSVKSEEDGIYLDQIDYIDKLLNKYGIKEGKPVGTPIATRDDKVYTTENENYDITKYQELVGELLYIANRTRPDIAVVTSYLSQFNHRPQTNHFKLGKTILRYLNGTKYKKLYYSRNIVVLKAYSDASWGNADDGKSFTGGVLLIGDSRIVES